MFLTKKRLLKTLLVLLTVLVVVLAAAVALRYLRDGEAEAGSADSSGSAPVTPPATSIQLSAPEAAFSALTYSNGITTLSFSQEGDGTWYWDGDREFPLDTACIDAILAELATLEPSMSITNGDTLEAYGLDEHVLYLTAQYPDGTRLHLDFGSKVPNGTAHYVLMDDDPDTVYVLETDIPSRMGIAIYDMMLLPQLPQLEEADFSSITVRGEKETMLVAFISHAEGTPAGGSESAAASSGVSSGAAAAPETSEVSWRWDGFNVSGRGLLPDLTADLSALKLNRCENFKPSDASVTAFGLDNPAATVEITYGKDQALSLTIGSETLAGGAYYVRLGDDTTIYSMDKTMLDTVLTVSVHGLFGPQPADTEDTGDMPAA